MLVKRQTSPVDRLVFDLENLTELCYTRPQHLRVPSLRVFTDSFTRHHRFRKQRNSSPSDVWYGERKLPYVVKQVVRETLRVL